MKKRRRSKKRWPRLLLVALLMFCCYTAASHRGSSMNEDGNLSINASTGSFSGASSLFRQNVDLMSGSFPKDTADLVAVLQSGETALLDQFENLISADFRGSVCYDEITAWAKNHPAVRVVYDITMPNGEKKSPDESVFDYSGLSRGEILQNAEMFPYFSRLSAVTLGNLSNTAESLTAEDLNGLKARFPSVQFNYRCELNGQSYGAETTSLDLTALGKENLDQTLAVLSLLPNLQTLELGNASNGTSPFTLDDVSRISAACPSVSCNYVLDLYGRTISLSDDHIDLNHVSVSDNGAAVRQVLRAMPNCQYLDMDSCGVPNEIMAQIRDEFPAVDVVWRVDFGSNYSVRTNVTKILASKPSVGGALTNSNSTNLKYCTNVHYLDLGHNDDLSDFSFVTYMPELEICVASITAITDLTPFASCSNLVWLECGSTGISDLSPLANCKKLRHLNVAASDAVHDISPLYDIPMRRLWLGVSDPVPAEQVAQMQSLHPKCEINTTVPTGRNDPNGPDWSSGNWKYYQQLLARDWEFYSNNNNTFPAQRPMGYWKVVYKCFKYNLADRAYSFTQNDPLYYDHGDDVQPVNVFLIDLSLLDEDWEDYTQDESSPRYLQPDILDEPPGDTVWVGTY